MSEPLADGVWLHLPFSEYIAQRPRRLGTTDASKLWTAREGFWWSSANNPFRPKIRKSTPELLYGEAAHAALLEGLHAYESRFCVEPDKRLYPDLLVSVDDIKKALREAGAHVGPTSGWKKEDWNDAAEIHLPGANVWDSIYSEFLRRMGSDRQPIPAEDDFAIRALRDLAIEDRPENEELRELMSVGGQFPILAEVSVFYTDESGIQHCARFDKLLPVVNGELKTIGEWRGRALADSLDNHIKDMGYDVQLACQHVARQAMNRMLLESEDNLHGGTEEERKHLMAMALWNQTNRWSHAWIFMQKPTAAGVAPVLLPLRDPWRGPYHLAGFRKRAKALDTYRRCMERFGPNRPWGRVEPVHWVDEGAEHHIRVSEFGWGPDDPAEGEEEHMNG